MRPLARLAAAAAVLSLSGVASAASPEESEAPAASPSNGDLFPAAGHATAAAATGVPFPAIAEIGYAFTNGFALGAIGGVALAYVPNLPTPSVPTAGIRPRLRVATSQHTSLVLIARCSTTRRPGPVRPARAIRHGWSHGPRSKGDKKLSRFLVHPTKDHDEIRRRIEWMQLRFGPLRVRRDNRPSGTKRKLRSSRQEWSSTCEPRH